MNAFFLSLADVYSTYSLIIRLFAFGITISSLEYLTTLQMYSENGIFSWEVSKLTPKILKSSLHSDRLNFLFGKYAIFTLTVFRLISAVYLFICPISAATVYLIAILAFFALYIDFRDAVGKDGSDQMNKIISLTLFITFVSHDKDIAVLGLYFIACQAVLSYLIAGIAKLVSRKWTSGIAIQQIMNTETYGNRPIAMYLFSASHATNLAANWNIIIVECLFPSCLVIGYPYMWVFIIWGLLFHLYNAVFMGLNGFLWAFLATYPAIFFVNFDLYHRFVF
jgi:hypothetical protein